MRQIYRFATKQPFRSPTITTRERIHEAGGDNTFIPLGHHNDAVLPVLVRREVKSVTRETYLSRYMLLLLVQTSPPANT